MPSRYHLSIAMASLILTLGAGASWGGPPPPPNPTSSDDNENTAGGTGALDSTGGASFDNTAFGGNALTSNTSGYDNTATGFEALFSNTGGGYRQQQPCPGLQRRPQPHHRL